MIQQLEQVPANMVGFRATGEVTKEDFEQVVIPAVERSIEKTGVLNYMLVLDTSVKEFNVGAWLQDAFMGIKHLTKWNRAAIVSDSKGIKTFTDIFSKLMPGEFRGFDHADMQTAIDWVSEKK